MKLKTRLFGIVAAASFTTACAAQVVHYRDTDRLDAATIARHLTVGARPVSQPASQPKMRGLRLLDRLEGDRAPTQAAEGEGDGALAGVDNRAETPAYAPGPSREVAAPPTPDRILAASAALGLDSASTRERTYEVRPSAGSEAPVIAAYEPRPVPRAEAPVASSYEPRPVPRAEAPVIAAYEPRPKQAEAPAAASSGFSLPVHFAFNSSRLMPESLAQLDVVAEGIRIAGPGVRVLIEGHTDSVGSARYNVDLSRKRAHAVKAYLVVRHGIAESVLITHGMGSTNPINRSNPMAGENRRVEFRPI